MVYSSKFELEIYMILLWSYFLIDWTGKKSIWGFEKPGEAASIGSWGVCEETITYSDAVYARTSSFTSQDSCKAVTWWDWLIMNEMAPEMLVKFIIIRSAS